MEKYEDICRGILRAIEKNETYTRLMSGNENPTLDDGINMLTLLSVIHDDLKLVVEG